MSAQEGTSPQGTKLDNASVRRVRKKGTPFSEAVKTYAHLLEHNYRGSDTQEQTHRRRCVQLILDAFCETLQKAKNSNQARLIQDLNGVLSRCLRTFGCGDSQLRTQVINVLEKSTTITPNTSLIKSVQVRLIEFLPVTFGQIPDATSSQHALQAFHRLVAVGSSQPNTLQNIHRSALRIPLLKSLAVMPLQDFAKKEIMSFIHGQLQKASSQEFPDLCGCLLYFCSTPKHCTAAVSGIRQSWIKRERQQRSHNNSSNDPSNQADLLSRTLHAMVSSFADSRDDIQLLFETSYLGSLDHFGGQEGNSESCHALDLAYLLYMQQQGSRDFESQVKQIHSAWIATNRFPYDALRSVCRSLSRQSTILDHHIDKDKNFLQGIESVMEPMMQSLLELALSLVTEFEWASTLQGRLLMEDQTIEFVLYLHNEILSLGQQRILTRSFVESWKYALLRGCGTEDAGCHTVVRQVGRIIEELAKHHSTITLEFSDLFVRVLLSSFGCPGFESAGKTSCVVLSHLGCKGQHNQAELIQLIQKLLFSGQKPEWTSRGLLLASAAIQTGCGGDRAMRLVQESVLRTVLPPQRKMIDPESGPPCLAFFRAWEQQKGKDSDAFNDFQMLLSNTGLIQSLSRYKKQTKKRKYPANLGFAKVPAQFSHQTTDPLPKAAEMPTMVFCVAYFVRAMDASSPGRFASTAKWVFELVDTYLEIGRRQTSSQWRVSDWLDAPIEFPELRVKFEATTKQQKAALRWLEQELCTFELRTENTSNVQDDIESSVVDLLSEDSFLFEAKDWLRSLYDSSLALFVSAVVLAAVVKNAFAHYASMTEDDEQRGATLQHIGFQLLKVYEIRKRCESVNSIVKYLDSAIVRKLKPGPCRPDRVSSSKTHNVTSGSFQHEVRRYVLGPISAQDCFLPVPLNQYRWLKLRGFSTSSTSWKRKCFRRLSISDPICSWSA